MYMETHRQNQTSINFLNKKLNDDIVGVIKTYLYVNIPPELTIEEAQFIIYINKLKTKELKTICKENKIKQSKDGTTNKFIVRMNIVEWVLSKKNMFAIKKCGVA